MCGFGQKGPVFIQLKGGRPRGWFNLLLLLVGGLFLLVFGVWLLLVWRMGVSMEEYRHNNEVSFILQMPVWWGYAASMPAAVVGLIAYAWRLLESLGLATPPPGFAMAGGGH